MDRFIDIRELSLKRSDVGWVLKDYESNLPYYSTYKNKDYVKSSLLKSDEFLYDLKLISDKTHRSIGDLLKESSSIFDGMTHNLGFNSVRFMGVILSKLLKALYGGVMIEASGIERIREAHKNHTVILMPTHRSYADFLFISYIMFNFDLPLPVITAAMDFMNMKFVGELLRKCGAFFIRRSFANDDLYWAIFSHYVKTIIRITQEPLEFFIEGTRSRTNKSLFPKLGLLGIIFESWLSGISQENVVLIPISISYDRILEEKLYAWEMLGVPKPKETTKGLLNLRHIVKENFGKVYFTVGEAINLKESAIEFGGIEKYTHSLQLKFKPILFEREKEFLRYLAIKIVAKQQESLYIPDFSVVAMVISTFLITKQQATTSVDNMESGTDNVMSMDEFTNIVHALLKYLYRKNNRITSPTNDDKDATIERIKNAIQLHEGLVKVTKDSSQSDSISIVTQENDDSQSNQSTVSSDKLPKLIPYMMLSNYRNPLLFHVAKESFLLNLSLPRDQVIDNEYSDKENKSDYEFLLSVFARELVYENKSTQLDEHIRNLTLELSNQPIRDLIRKSTHGLLISYYLYSRILLVNPEILQEKNSVKIMHGLLQNLVSHNLISSMAIAEILTTDKIKNFIVGIKPNNHKFCSKEVMIRYCDIIRRTFRNQYDLATLDDVIDNLIAAKSSQS